MRITINAGHHKTLDAGACAHNLREADITYEIGKEVQRLLIDAGEKVKFVQSDSLQTICDVSNNFESDIFVSIHCNASGTGRAGGTETYFYPGSNGGRNLANYVQREIINQIGTKMAYFYVLKNTLAAAILVETAFIDNYNDALLLRNRRADFARAIADGILKYKTALK